MKKKKKIAIKITRQLAMALWLRMAGLKKSTHTGGRQTLSVYRLHFYVSIIYILYLLSFFNAISAHILPICSFDHCLSNWFY